MAISACAAVATPEPTLILARPTPDPVVVTAEATIAEQEPVGIASDGTALWVFAASGEITRIDPSTNKVGTSGNVDPAFEAAGLWITDFDANIVYRLDPTTLAVIAQIPVPDNPGSAAVADGAVWVTQHRGGTVTRIDPATNEIVATVEVGHRGPGGPHAVGFGLGSVWISAGNAPSTSGRYGDVVRIDPATNEIQATISLPSSASACGGFAITDLAVWMPSCFDQPVLVRIDPSTNKVAATIALGGYGGDPVLIDGALWFTITSEGDIDPTRIVRIDPSTNTIDRVISLGDAFRGETMVVASGSLWVADAPNNQVLRLPLSSFE
jgi:YVTN family beta-propeller protein